MNNIKRRTPLAPLREGRAIAILWVDVLEGRAYVAADSLLKGRRSVKRTSTAGELGGPRALQCQGQIAQW